MTFWGWREARGILWHHWSPPSSVSAQTKTLIWCSHQWLTVEMEWILSAVFCAREIIWLQTDMSGDGCWQINPLNEMSQREIWRWGESLSLIKSAGMHRGEKCDQKKKKAQLLVPHRINLINDCLRVLCTKWWGLLTSGLHSFEKQPGQHN